MRKSAIFVGVAAALLLAGTGMAASRWVITSVHQIKPSVLRELHGKEGPRGATGPQGPAGAPGAAGVAGATGAPGSFSTANVTVVSGAPATMCPSGAGDCASAGSAAACPYGAVALGGGWSGPVVESSVGYDYPITNDTAWDVVMSNNSAIDETFTPYVVCATGTGAALARPARVIRSDVAAQAAANLKAVRAAARLDRRPSGR